MHKPYRTRFRWVNTLGVLFAIFLIAGCSGDEQSWERIAREGRLKVGVDPSFPPFEATDGTELFGIDVDLAEAIGSELGLEPQYSHFGYDGLYDALLSGQVDVLISALVIFPERTKDFSYSEPYFDAGQVLVSPVKNAVGDLDELKGKKVAVELGAEGHSVAAAWQRQNGGVTIVPYDSAEEALEALNADQTDAALTDAIGAYLYINDVGINAGVNQISSEPFAMVVRSEDELLLKNLNAALTRIREAGQLDAIISQWLSP